MRCPALPHSVSCFACPLSCFDRTATEFGCLRRNLGEPGKSQVGVVLNQILGRLIGEGSQTAKLDFPFALREDGCRFG